MLNTESIIRLIELSLQVQRVYRDFDAYREFPDGDVRQWHLNQYKADIDTLDKFVYVIFPNLILSPVCTSSLYSASIDINIAPLALDLLRLEVLAHVGIDYDSQKGM